MSKPRKRKPVRPPQPLDFARASIPPWEKVPDSSILGGSEPLLPLERPKEN